MKSVDYYRWKVKDRLGKWYTTRHEASEEQIRKEHPEAVRLDHTKVTRQIPETTAEMNQRMYMRPFEGAQQPEHPVGPTLLRFPFWANPTVLDERPLTLPTEAYSVENLEGGRSIVKVRATGEVVFDGAGPAQVIDNPYPPF
jgi:hypothetical protein